VELRGLGVEMNRPVVGLPDAVHEVARHALREVAAAQEHVNLLRRVGKKEGRLSGRVAAPDDHDLFPAAHLGLHLAGRVVDPHSLKLVEPVEPPAASSASLRNSKICRVA